MDKSNEILFTAVIVQAAAFIAKIIWDWLKRPVGQHGGWGCPLHSECRDDLQRCEGGIMELRQSLGRHDVLITEHSSGFKRELEKGEKVFDQILTAVQQLKEAYVSHRERLIQIERQLSRLDGTPLFREQNGNGPAK